MIYYLSLGSNLGDREQTLRKALELIEQQVGHITRCSKFYYSAPWGFESTHEFCNLCCCIESTYNPHLVLKLTAEVEQTLGRRYKSVNGVYHDRPIDIDIIRAFDENGKEIEINTSVLAIPHPRWKERDFVTVPLREIMPENN